MNCENIANIQPQWLTVRFVLQCELGEGCDARARTTMMMRSDDRKRHYCRGRKLGSSSSSGSSPTKQTLPGRSISVCVCVVGSTVAAALLPPLLCSLVSGGKARAPNFAKRARYISLSRRTHRARARADANCECVCGPTLALRQPKSYVLLLLESKEGGKQWYWNRQPAAFSASSAPSFSRVAPRRSARARDHLREFAQLMDRLSRSLAASANID